MSTADWAKGEHMTPMEPISVYFSRFQYWGHVWPLCKETEESEKREQVDIQRERNRGEKPRESEEMDKVILGPEFWRSWFQDLVTSGTALATFHILQWPPNMIFSLHDLW